MRHGLRETNGLIGFLSPLAGATHVFDWSGVPANTEDEHLPRMVGGWAAYNTNQYEGLRDGLSAFLCLWVGMPDLRYRTVAGSGGASEVC